MVHVLAEIHVAVPPCRHVEVALHFVQLHAAEDPARVRLHPALQSRRLGEPLAAPREVEDILDALGDVVSLVALLEVVPALLLSFQSAAVDGPGGLLLAQHGGGEDAVAAGVLDVDVHVGTAHGDDDVEVDLERVADVLFDREMVGGGAAVVGCEWGYGEEERQGEQEEGDATAGLVAGEVSRVRFCWDCQYKFGRSQWRGQYGRHRRF